MSITAVFTAGYLVLLTGKATLSWLAARTKLPHGVVSSFETATILQAILSGDPRLEATLDANIQALPGARFLWLVDDDDSEAREIAEKIRLRRPDARIDVLPCPPVPPATNPKLHKLALAESKVSSLHLVVLDDDTLLPPETLRRLLAALDTHALSTGLPIYCHGDNLPSRLVEQFVNSQSALTYLSWLRLHPPITINGMIYALKTSAWKELGGFKPLVYHLTDDVAVAHAVLNGGGTLHQSPAIVHVSTTVRNGRRYLSLMHRWFLFALLLTRTQPLRLQVSILILHGLPPVILWASLLAMMTERDFTACSLTLALLVFRSALIIGIQTSVTGGSRHHALYSLCSELFQPFHFLHAWFVRTIFWRGRRIFVRNDHDFDYA